MLDGFSVVGFLVGLRRVGFEATGEKIGEMTGERIGFDNGLRPLSESLSESVVSA